MQPTPIRERLTVRVAPDLVLDMGTVERASASPACIHPPATPLFDQVVRWLDTRPEANPIQPDSPSAAVASALVCVRWGTWFALLTDPALPPWPHAKDRETSTITNEEMARLNIEASSALELWIDLLRTDRDRWSRLAGRALANLPWSGGTVKPKRDSPFWLLNSPRLRELVAALSEPDRERMSARVAANPTRLCANAVANNAWRNGPIEDIHAGRHYRGSPLTQRRVLHAAEKRVLDHAAGELAPALTRLATTRGQRPSEWADTVLPFALPFAPWSAPSDWSTTERSRAILLDAEGYVPDGSPTPTLPDTPAREISRDKPSI